MPAPLDTPQFTLPGETYTPPAGSNRLLVLMLNATGTTLGQNVEPTTVSVTNDDPSPVTVDFELGIYGLTPGGGNRPHIGFYFIREANIPSGLLTLNVVYDTTPANGVGGHLFVVDGRDQTTPIRDSNFVWRSTTDTTFDGPGLTTATGDMIIASAFIGGAPTTISAPAGYNTLYNLNTSDLSFRDTAAFWLDEAVDTAEDPVISLSAADAGSAVFLALAPAGASAAGLVIDTVDDSTPSDGDTITFDVSNGDAGGYEVILSPTDDIDDGLATAQTVDSSDADSVTVTVSRTRIGGQFPFETNVFVFIRRLSDDVANTTGFPIQFQANWFIEDTLINLSSTDLPNETGITVYYWLAAPTGQAPASVTAETSDADGLLSVPFDGSSLDPNVATNIWVTIWDAGGAARGGAKRVDAVVR